MTIKVRTNISRTGFVQTQHPLSPADLDNNFVALDTADVTEASTARSAEASLTSSAASLSARVSTEEANRSAAVSTEASTARSAELSLSQRISAEASLARADEASLASSISQGDLNLNNIIVSEASTARSAELSLSQRVTTEASTARSAEAALSNSTTSLSARLSSEETNRASAISTEASTARSAELSLANKLTTATAGSPTQNTVITSTTSNILSTSFDYPTNGLDLQVYRNGVRQVCNTDYYEMNKAGSSVVGNQITIISPHMYSDVYQITLPGGSSGATGPQGTLNQLYIGTVSGLPTGYAPTASITGSAPYVYLNLGIPAGPVGPQGGQGIQGIQGIQGPAGAAGAGGCEAGCYGSCHGSCYAACADDGSPCGNGPSSCFPETTLITMRDGSLKNITLIDAGDEVADGFGGFNTVLGYYVTLLGDRRLYRINHAADTTGDHLFLTNTGWSPVSIKEYNNRKNREYEITKHDQVETIFYNGLDGVTALGPQSVLKMNGGYTEQLSTIVEMVEHPDFKLRGLVVDGTQSFVLATGYIVDGFIGA